MAWLVEDMVVGFLCRFFCEFDSKVVTLGYAYR